MADRTCSEKGCQRKHRARGLCSTHYTAARKAGIQLELKFDPGHSLSNVDVDKCIAICATCGPVKIRASADLRVRGHECENSRRASHRRSHRRRKYGLTESEYEAMTRSQSGACAICGIDDVMLVVDHDHESGAIRGLLCHPCNVALGFLKDNVDNVSAAAEYLRRHGQARQAS